KYMQDIYSDFSSRNPDIETILQKENMTEAEKEAFVDSFVEQSEKTFVGFAVLGGSFSEGIDLVGERLIGVAIIGVGLTQINVQTDIIRDYFDRTNGKGFEYAYMYPGMNRVLQAAGRVIRKADDKGVVLLIDERFLHSRYLELFPRHWSGYKLVFDSHSLKRSLEESSF
ncbi:MAG TPA: helicase C-terminal domain-containing protein, partial [Clostridia bacterium]|nr:helicase C-terminal domain-containing protein [Clostridia bacterium]